MNRCFTAGLALGAAVVMTACGGGENKGTEPSAAAHSRVITDGAGRVVELPENVESIVCSGVGALRYTCYMQASQLVVGVEDYEKETDIHRGYNYVNGELFSKLPVIGANGEPYAEAMIAVDPDVIIMSARSSADADTLQDTTGIPVVVVPGSDEMLDAGAYETLRIMGEVYGKEERARELTDYLDGIKADLGQRVADIPKEGKPSVYICGMSFQGARGFEGTEAGYGPLAALSGINLADETGQDGAFTVEKEQILAWDPDVIFVDYAGLPLIEEDVAANKAFYEQLKAVQEGRVYAQIPFRSYASNLDTALADTYYMGTVLYPEQFADVDVEAKAGEIFETLLGRNIYEELQENGYAFGQISLGE